MIDSIFPLYRRHCIWIDPIGFICIYLLYIGFTYIIELLFTYIRDCLHYWILTIAMIEVDEMMLILLMIGCRFYHIWRWIDSGIMALILILWGEWNYITCSADFHEVHYLPVLFGFICCLFYWILVFPKLILVKALFICCSFYCDWALIH